MWNQEVTNVKPMVITDISKEFYNPQIPLQDFQQKYPWFQGSVPDAIFVERRTNKDETKIYKEAVAKIDVPKLQKEVATLFARIKMYFPKFAEPKVYIYSSALHDIKQPIIWQPQLQLMFVDISAFLGENNANYKGLEQYFQKSMNPGNIVPKISELIAEQIVPANGDHQKFIDQLVYQGKIMTLQDAFLPEFPNFLKINYTQKQYDWAAANEANIWNYFVENNLVFGDDPRLVDRFISPGPFSKFYTEIDNQSSPQIGIFIGWQICKKYFDKNSETKLQDFLQKDATEIFNNSDYKPVN